MDTFEALRDHYLAGIDCNEENHTDKAACSCALMMSSPQPSIGQAVQQWIDHVRDVVEGRWTQQGALDAIRAAKR